MTTTRNNEFSISVLLVFGLLVAVAIIYVFIFSVAEDGFGKNMERVNQQQDDALLARIRPVVTLEDILGTEGGSEVAPVVVATKSPKELFDGACMACHSTGVAGAPKLGDAAAWEPRLSAGLETLVSSAIAGKGAMPPKGGTAYSEEEIKAVVTYMLSEAGLMDAPTAAEAPAQAPVAETQPVTAPEPATSVAGGRDLKAGEATYRKVCFACHDSGVAGAPKLGDKVAWSGRVGAGFDALLQSALNGKGAMPPKGGAMHLSDTDIGNVVAFMLKNVQ